MEVFNVIVLVLLAGAVPCHGMTESLGTVFNKTQPHESMNNITVSSSKLEAYDLLYLVMRWPMSFCFFNQPCPRRIPGHFTVHGLWPQRAVGPSLRGIDCGRINGLYRLFDFHQLYPVLMRGLNMYWPDLQSVENRHLWDNNNHRFWKNEYNKHGACTFDDQNAYFRLTVAMVRQLEVLVVNPALISGGGILSGNLYRPSYIRDAVHRATNKMPMLICKRVGGLYYLYEIYFCAHRNSEELCDCDWYSNCGYETVRGVKIL